MEITRKIVFHAGHMLKDDDSKCYHPHGHEYILECTLKGETQTSGPSKGMVKNFGDLKAAMMTVVHDEVDHKFIIEESDPRFSNFVKAVGEDAIYVVQFPPTAENLARHFYYELETHFSVLDQIVNISRLRLQETYQCWAEYVGD